jgi:hypothetical protein
MKKIVPVIILLYFCLNPADAQNKKKNSYNPDCDTAVAEVFIAGEEPPKRDLDDSQIEKMINGSFDSVYIRKFEGKYFYIYLKVDCMGRTYGYQTSQASDSIISHKIVAFFRNNVKWSSGKIHGEPAIYGTGMKFKINNGMLMVVEK